MSRAEVHCNAHGEAVSQKVELECESVRDMRDERVCAQCGADGEPLYLHRTENYGTAVYLHAECERFWNPNRATNDDLSMSELVERN
jgi:hypothetical protein